MGERPRVLAVQHTPDGGPGRFGTWLAEGGLALDVVRAHDGEPLPGRLSHQALLVLGGGYMPDDDERAPWLAPTRDLVAGALDGGVPVFGICLGGQLLALLAGGAVAAGHGEPEMGSTALTLRPEAEHDPLFHGLPRRTTAIENHVDAVTGLPPGARWLAESERCPYQAFSVGDRAWGTQFHPEATAARVRAWDPRRLVRHGFDPAGTVRRAEADEPASAAVWRTVALRFAGLVRGL
ncbi:type 1 glutamine amidotransferase [Streptomyces desertarenae]|uniref:Type 1 glutamine amidotransferase n=1 Tax=Streptomyces desertarenae TaxID=2666184 RepID=A0ABW4PC87_9ACTN